MKERYRRVAATDQTTTTLLEDRWMTLCTITVICAKDVIHDECDMDPRNVRFGSKSDIVDAATRKFEKPLGVSLGFLKELRQRPSSA